MGIAIAILLVVVLLVGPELAQFSPSAVNSGSRLSPPGPEHWFGTDVLGRDLFSRVVHGFRVSLVISLAATLLTALPGVSLGLVSGYYQGWIDQLLSRMVEVLLALPGMLLAIVLITRFGSSLPTLIVALGITGIPTFFRITRNETLSMSKQLFVESSRSLGISTPALITGHIFPNIFPTLLVLTSMRMGTYLLMGSGLGFIGLGIQPPLSELGALLASGKEFYQTAWWLYTFPAAFIFLSVLCFNLLGEGLRDFYTRH
jgi:ABC-type dipeptide/oligopeptide/nickel transport system permease subunit